MLNNTTTEKNEFIRNNKEQKLNSDVTNNYFVFIHGWPRISFKLGRESGSQESIHAIRCFASLLHETCEVKLKNIVILAGILEK